MFINILASVMIASAIGIGATNVKENTNINNADINYAYYEGESSSSEEVSYPIYDDGNETITLSAYQANNYTWENLFNFINNVDFSNAYFGYNGFELEDFLNNDTQKALKIYNSSDSYSYINFIYDVDTYNIINETDYSKNYILLWSNSGEIEEFDDFVFIHINEGSWNTLKSAIQSDIQANEGSGNVGESIITAIASGLGLIGDLATEFLTGFSTLFWDSTNNVLTPFAIFALVMLGLAITMAIISLVLNIIRNDSGV